MSEILTHPEVELRMKKVGTEWCYTYVKEVTMLNILEIYADSKAVMRRGIGWKEFEDYCNAEDVEHCGLLLRVIFIEKLFLPPQVNKEISIIVTGPEEPNDNTAYLMHKHFGVPMLFFRDQTPVISHLTIGNATFTRRKKGANEEILSLDGYYQFCSEFFRDIPTHVWYSYSTKPKERACNYIINRCSSIAKNLILEYAGGPDALLLVRPFSIDGFLFNDIIIQMNRALIDPRAELLRIENITFNDTCQMMYKVRNIIILHNVARHFHLLKDTITAITETLDYLIEVQKHHTTLVAPGEFIHDPDRDSARESLMLIRYKASSITRELLSLEARASLKIDLEYSMQNQQDSRTNLRIARLTTSIAAASQKDSSSMITMAAVTMFFLPGTFVSAIFSTVFFSPMSSNDESGSTNFVSTAWWLYPLITIPLTALVFFVWKIWCGHRNLIHQRELECSLGLHDIEEQSDTFRRQNLEKDFHRPMIPTLAVGLPDDLSLNRKTC